MSRDEINALLWSMPADDRLAALICATVTRKPQAVSAVISLAAVATVMAGYLNDRDRIELAEVWRDAADTIEHRRVRVLVRLRVAAPTTATTTTG